MSTDDTIDAAAIAFFTADADGFLPTVFSRSLWAPSTLNGPAITGLAARTAETEYGLPEFRPARFTIDMFKAAREVRTTTRSRLIRDGGRIKVAEVELMQDTGSGEQVIARSTTVFLRESQNPPGQRWSNPADADFTHPEVGDDDPRTWFRSADQEWSDDMAGQQNPLRKQLWSKAPPVVLGDVLTPFQRASISSESTSLMANWGTTGIGFINCDLTLAMSRLPVGDRIGVRTESHTEHTGISMSVSGLFDVDGKFGVGIVTAVNNAAAEIDFTTVDTTARYAEG